MFNVEGYTTTIHKNYCENSKCKGRNTSVAEKCKICEVECEEDESTSEKIVVFRY